MDIPETRHLLAIADAAMKNRYLVFLVVWFLLCFFPLEEHFCLRLSPGILTAAFSEKSNRQIDPKQPEVHECRRRGIGQCRFFGYHIVTSSANGGYSVFTYCAVASDGRRRKQIPHSAGLLSVLSSVLTSQHLPFTGTITTHPGHSILLT